MLKAGMICNGARRGEYMTNQCKFGMGNYLFIPSAGDTCVSVMRGVKLCSLQSSRLQRKRMEYNTVSPKWNGRSRPSREKAVTDTQTNCNGVSAFPVSCQLHGTKDMLDKSGDLALSMNMPRKVVE